MIKLEVLKSNDKDSVSVYNFHFDKIKIGYSLVNDIIIRERNWKESYFEIKIVDDKIKIKSNSNIDHFFCNNKKVFGAKIIKLNDIIRYNDTEFKIIEVKRTSPDDIDIISLYRDRIEKSPEIINLLDSIEEELRGLD